MSSRPHSLNDVEIPVLKIRRDQFKKIKGIVELNAKFPLVALGLVRDYCKGIENVIKVRFDNEQNPQWIIVHTPDTGYHFKFVPFRKLETPTL